MGNNILAYVVEGAHFIMASYLVCGWMSPQALLLLHISSCFCTLVIWMVFGCCTVTEITNKIRKSPYGTKSTGIFDLVRTTVYTVTGCRIDMESDLVAVGVVVCASAMSMLRLHYLHGLLFVVMMMTSTMLSMGLSPYGTRILYAQYTASSSSKRKKWEAGNDARAGKLM